MKNSTYDKEYDDNNDRNDDHTTMVLLQLSTSHKTDNTGFSLSLFSLFHSRIYTTASYRILSYRIQLELA